MRTETSKGIQDIAEKIRVGARLSFEDGIRLFESGDISTLAKLAHKIREKRHGRKAFYIKNMHFN